ncbi:MAG: cation diffusion facilitator family transporter [Candidatus Tyrphobacter sp.]
MRYGRFSAALAVSLVVAAVEVYGGLRAQSLGLIADAVHAGTDAFAIGIMLVASYLAARPANRRKTFGYGRLEVLGAVFNGALLLGITAVIAYGAVQRLMHPLHPQGTTMAAISAVAFFGNIGAGLLLLQGARRSINARGAFIHVAGDAMGSFAVLIAGALIAWTHRAWLDPAFSLVVCAIVVAGVAHMVREALDILLEAVPRGVDLMAIENAIGSVPGVVGVHELHAWSIGAGADALSAHVLVARAGEEESALRVVRGVLRERFDMTHVTLQIEREHCGTECEAEFPTVEKPTA